MTHKRNTSPLDTIGKQLPYTVPEDFFVQLEENIRLAVLPQPAKPRPHRSPRIGMAAKSCAAIAASLIALCILDTSVCHPASSGMAEVEQAFTNLSPEDQHYLLSVYQDDIFMNEP